MVKKTPSQLFWKLSWDSERPASSAFTLGKRKKSSGEWSGGRSSGPLHHKVLLD
jgi:hypothetical protein